MSAKRLTPLSRALRQSATEAEEKMWKHLRNRQLDGFKFRRQSKIGGFIGDFVCEQTRIIIELDGSQHGERIEQDTARTVVLESNGYRVLRFWNSDVLQNMSGVLEVIRNSLRDASHR